jgi:TetR/AcrR family transcriptional regulator, transcriptional repressor for nem operon
MQLLDAGLATFLRDGYHGAGLQDILASISMPKGSFYAYFRSKEDFAVAVIDHYAARFRAKFDAAMAAKPSPLAALRAFFERLRKDFKTAEFAGGCLVANLAGEIEDSEPCRAALKRAYGGWTDGVREAIRRAQQAGEVRADIKAVELADLLVDSWEGAVIRMKVERTTAPLDRCIKRHFDGFLLP